MALIRRHTGTTLDNVIDELNYLSIGFDGVVVISGTDEKIKYQYMGSNKEVVFSGESDPSEFFKGKFGISFKGDHGLEKLNNLLGDPDYKIRKPLRGNGKSLTINFFKKNGSTLPFKFDDEERLPPQLSYKPKSKGKYITLTNNARTHYKKLKELAGLIKEIGILEFEPVLEDKTLYFYFGNPNEGSHSIQVLIAENIKPIDLNGYVFPIGNYLRILGHITKAENHVIRITDFGVLEFYFQEGMLTGQYLMPGLR